MLEIVACWISRDTTFFLLGLLLGAVLSLWMNLFSAKWLNFKELRLRGITAFADFCDPNQVRVFIQNNRAIEDTFRPIIIAFISAKHDAAASQSMALGKKLDEELAQLLTNPPDNDRKEMQNHDHRFVLNALDHLRTAVELNMPKLEVLKPNWWALINPLN